MVKPAPAVSVRSVHKVFRLPHDRKNSLKQTVLSFERSKYEELEVLKDVNFDVAEGEFFGILGRNGSGKSTLLKLIAGIYSPTSGNIEIRGSLTPFIELGIGFNAELSGRDNVFLNGAILGLSRTEITSMYDDIVAFAELERFMDQKLHNYSSGMLVRLAFSIAIRAHNNILLIDEVLAVGDANFQQKCLNIFRELRKSGKTVILVTHDMNAVEEFCDRAILIEDGDITMTGKSRDVANRYRRINFEELNESERKSKESKKVVTRWGNKFATIESVEVKNKGTSVAGSLITSEDIVISTNVSYIKDIDDPITGIQVRDAAGLIIFGANSKSSGLPKTKRQAGDKINFSWCLPNIFKSGVYFVTVAVHDYGGRPYDWWSDAMSFVVEREEESSAAVIVKSDFSVDGINFRK